MKKTARIAVLIISVFMGIYLTCFLGNPIRYSECIVNEEQYEKIIAERDEVPALLSGVVFDEETLMFDSTDGTFYYSLVEGNPGAYDPGVMVKSDITDVKVAFLENSITEEGIKNNQTIPFLAYTDASYTEYALKCTTLPLMNIECGVEIGDSPIPMSITLFDNRLNTVSRTTASEGTIHVRGNTTTVFPKKGYRFSLTKESVGNNVRPNQISLLGMRQDEDWLLYGAYNDQEKIRNVFSSNLWEYSCGTDNVSGINTGMEYKYLELFIDGEYWGLYALGYPIDEKQLMLNSKSGKEGLYKGISWFNESDISFTEGGNLVGFRIKGTANEATRNWEPILNYYYNLSLNQNENDKLYAGIDMDNAVDIYLFINLIQGLDHAMGGRNIKNIYLAVSDSEEGPTALYAPWDMDITWGNGWVNDLSANLTVPYELSVSHNILMHSGYLNQLIVNEADGIWEQIFDKYRYLREKGWSEESINTMLDEYEADIYASGAYLREMERWPQGSYADASEGLSIFRAYVMERLKEMDAYYESLELSHDDGRQEYDLQVRINTFSDPAYYLEALSYTDYKVVIDINNPDIWLDCTYAVLLEQLGMTKESGCEEVVDSDENADIRIVVSDSDSGEIVDDVLFTYELNDTQGTPQIIITGFERLNLVED